MKKFRVKEVKEARISSTGQKASLYFPQVSTFFGLCFRNIKPSEIKGDKYIGKVVQFKSFVNANYFIRDQKELFNQKKSTKEVKQKDNLVKNAFDALKTKN